MSDIVTEQKTKEMALALNKFFTAEAETKQELTDEQKRELFKAIASDETSRKEYVKTRADLIVKQLPYQSTVRSIFKVDKLNGLQPSYPIDWDYTRVAILASSLGGSPHFLVTGDEISIPTFEIRSSVDFLMKYARDGRYNVGEDATKKLLDGIVAKEEYAGWRTLKAVFSGVNITGNNSQRIFTGGLGSAGNLFNSFSLSGLNLMLTRLETAQRKMTDVFLTPLRNSNVRGWITPDIDYYTQREIYKLAGAPDGRVYNTALHVIHDTTNLINDGEVFGFDVTNLGKMPIVQEVQTAEDPAMIREWKVGLLAREEIGFGVFDPWAIVQLRLDND